MKTPTSLMRNMLRRSLHSSYVPKYTFGNFKMTPEEKLHDIKIKEEILKNEKWTLPHPVWTE
jgi:hypothetical protein